MANPHESVAGPIVYTRNIPSLLDRLVSCASCIWRDPSAQWPHCGI